MYLGLELGSTRVKAVVIDSEGNVLDKSDYSWSSVLKDGYWTYDLATVDKAVESTLDSLRKTDLQDIEFAGISAMMHGYLAFDKDDNLLVPFRTWQNTTTSKAAEELSELFEFNIPERWSIAHLYQAILDNEPHVKDIAYITTLAGYVHYKLTGEKVLGIGDASGMFPVDSEALQYNSQYVQKFDALLEEQGLDYKLLDILPQIMLAGEEAGKGDISTTGGVKASNLKFCPPEGDAGTGMIATNAIKPKTGNVSAGTSVFAMVVLDKAIKSHYKEVDVVATPLGNEVAMVHANNCTLDINAWVNVFAEVLGGYNDDSVDMDKLYATLFSLAIKGDKNGGGLVNYPYVTGEQITNVKTGVPALLRLPNSKFSLANFMRTHLMSCLSALKIGFDILKDKEGVEVNRLVGHGGFFNTPKVGQEIMSAATNCEVGVMGTSNEGGAWGMSILAAFAGLEEETQLANYLDFTVFKDIPVMSVSASTADIDGFNEYMQAFKNNLYIEQEG